MKQVIAILIVLLSLAIYSLWQKQYCNDCAQKEKDLQRARRKHIEMQMYLDIASKLMNDTNIVIIAHPPEVEAMIKHLHEFRKQTSKEVLEQFGNSEQLK
jgi:bisphosphoglycerate-dependent phosphoglycerate mutase